MRTSILWLALIGSLTVTASADDAPPREQRPDVVIAGRSGEREIEWSPESTETGCEILLDVLESSRTQGEGSSKGLDAALRRDHIRLTFAKPKRVFGKLDVTEIVLTMPLSSGVFWVRGADGTMYQFTHFDRRHEFKFKNWLREGRPVSPQKPSDVEPVTDK